MPATQDQVPVPHSRTAPHLPPGDASPGSSPAHPLPTRLAGIVSALTLAAVGGSVVAPGAAPPAHAAPAAAGKALKVAASKKGAPYQWGAAGPHRFDCSGLTLYSYKRAGKKLPRTAQAQYNTTRRVAKADRRKGDLVFFHGGGGVYHVGIYAGSDRIWHSPKTGSWVKLERIWSQSVSYGRVG
ncbi:C40 family peptidase [Streptomyces sp. MRC013]|uniref:C40 family peptidase n=1 Tax=Streptomyces sp. MRC013 TaxID=2898276 RepID=UPI002026971E|nr:C40 family peptidase [Streptomyces sp. MRC013]URM92224.1 C40 family peptidase [Streptomyces sp. MRC013]